MVKRSHALPSAPERTRASPRHKNLRALFRLMITQITKLTMMARPAKSGRCQPPASAKKEKAAPLLYAIFDIYFIWS